MYPFTQNNLLENPEKYSYSEFSGTLFIESFKKQRRKFLHRDSNDISSSITNIVEDIRCELIFQKQSTGSLFIEIAEECIYNSHHPLLPFVIHRFEITKKLFSHYKSKKGITKEICDINSYILFSFILTKSVLNTPHYLQKIKYFSTLLKVNDLITSDLKINFSSHQLNIVDFLLNNENAILEGL